MQLDFSTSASHKPFILLILSADRGNRAPLRCIFEDMTDKNPTVKTAITGDNERFSYTHAIAIGCETTTPRDVMEAMGNNGDTIDRKKYNGDAIGRIEYIVRPVNQVELNVGIYEKSLLGYDSAQDVTRHHQAQIDYERIKADGGFENLNGCSEMSC